MSVLERDRPKYSMRGCFTCNGTGWDFADDCECRCVSDGIASSVEFDEVTIDVSDAVEAVVVGELVSAGSLSARADAGSLVRAAKRGSVPPSVEVLAAFARVDTDTAGRIMKVLSNAVGGMNV